MAASLCSEQSKSAKMTPNRTKELFPIEVSTAWMTWQVLK